MSTLTLKNAKVGMKVKTKMNWNDGCDYYFKKGNIYEIIEIDKDDEICPVKIDDCWFQPFELKIFEIVRG